MKDDLFIKKKKKKAREKGHDCLTGSLNPQINYLTKVSNLLFYFSTVKNEKKITLEKSVADI